jgi:chemotaxis family two-component system sensor kinase Cph1
MSDLADEAEPTVEASREETDANLAQERGKTDELLEQAGPAAKRVARSMPDNDVAAERAETDESLLVERHEVDEIVEEAKALLVQGHRAVGESKAAVARRDEFLAMVSHDLRNPLAVIAMEAEMIARLARGGPNATRIDTLAAEIVAASEQMRRMVGDLLDFTAIAMGAIKLSVERTDVRPLIAETVALLAPMAGAAGPSLSADTPDEPLLARFDRGRIRQVLVNLVDNAQRFTAAGGSVTDVRCAARGGGARLRSRHGHRHSSRRPTPRVRALLAGPRETTGAGWGWVSTSARASWRRTAVRIWASSEVGRGSEFFFTLPME